MRIKFIADILVKEPKPGSGMRTVELEFEKNLETERTIDDIIDNTRDILEQHWSYKGKDLRIKKISIIT